MFSAPIILTMLLALIVAVLVLVAAYGARPDESAYGKLLQPERAKPGPRSR